MRASKEWLLQRITAVMALLLIATALILAIYYSISLEEKQIGVISMILWQKCCSSALSTVVCSMAMYALMLHGAIGMKIIAEDYIANKIWRNFVVKLVFGFSYIASGVFALEAASFYIAKSNIGQINRDLEVIEFPSGFLISTDENIHIEMQDHGTKKILKRKIITMK